LNVTGKNGSMPFLLPSELSKDFCINPFLKIILQSKTLFTKRLYCATVPNTAFERQALPRINQEPIQSLYLPYSFNAGCKIGNQAKK
jgi:hypothetical protein